MDQATAERVVQAAREAGIELDVPDNPGGPLAAAEWLYTEALKEAARGVTNPFAQSVVRMVDDAELAARADLAGNTTQAPVREETRTEFVDLRGEKLPLPPDLAGEPLEMPRDLTTADDATVRRLASEYNAFFNRARWLLAQESSDLANAKILQHRALNKARVSVSPKDSDGNKKNADVVLAEAEIDPEYIDWSTKVQEHIAQVEVLKALIEIYKGNVDRCSREASIRADEWARARS